MPSAVGLPCAYAADGVKANPTAPSNTAAWHSCRLTELSMGAGLPWRSGRHRGKTVGASAILTAPFERGQYLRKCFSSDRETFLPGGRSGRPDDRKPPP